MRHGLWLVVAWAALFAAACGDDVTVEREPEAGMPAAEATDASQSLPGGGGAMREVAGAPIEASIDGPLRVALDLSDDAERAALVAALDAAGIEVNADAALRARDVPSAGVPGIPRGAWAVVAHPRTPVIDLTVRELRGLLTGVSGRWSALGGDDVPVRVVMALEAEAGVRRALRLPALAGGTVRLPAAEAIDFVESTPGSLGVVPVGALRPGVLPLVVGGWDPLRDAPAASPLSEVRWLSGGSAAERERVRRALGWTAVREPEPLGLVATGDYIPVRCVVEAVAIFSGGDMRGIFDRIGDHLRAADVAVVSMEVAATDRIEVTPCIDVLSQLILTAPPGAVGALAHAGVDVVTVAGNHAGDCHGGCPWPDAILDTLGHLDDAGLAHAGTGVDVASARAPAVVEVDEVRVAFLSYDVIAEWYWAREDSPGTAPFDLAALEDDVRAARAVADHVVVAFSWGEEYTSATTEEQREAARVAVEAGASVVVGNHPHWIQPIEVRGEAVVAYALGNFVFDQDWSAGTTQSVLLEVGLLPGRVLGFRARPVVIRHNHQPEVVPARGVEGREILERLWGAGDRLAGVAPGS